MKNESQLPFKPLDSAERDTVLGFLLRIAETNAHEAIRRVAKSLFNLLSRERASDPDTTVINL